MGDKPARAEHSARGRTGERARVQVLWGAHARAGGSGHGTRRGCRGFCLVHSHPAWVGVNEAEPLVFETAEVVGVGMGARDGGSGHAEELKGCGGR